ncbi:hypothetical protein AGMMS49992_11780 [Clostridia bacterium]|nr:hypothetical protein AGMMS49992_11780 [Clostridia bacterium]
MPSKLINTMMVSIEDIDVQKRIRRDNGPLDDLALDIVERGLINPINIMECSNSRYLLIAGLRRLEATKLLDLTEIRASVLSPMDADEMLMLEISENEQRKDFTIEEKLDYAELIRPIEREKANQRMITRKSQEFLGTRESAYPGESISSEDDRFKCESEAEVDTCEKPVCTCQANKKAENGESRKIIAKKAGFSSYTQMERAAAIAEKCPELFEKINDGSLTITRAHRMMNEDTFKADNVVASAPLIPDSVKHRALSPEEQDIKHRMQEQVVELQEVDIPRLELFDPTSIQLSGEGVNSADHRALMSNPIYNKLYAEYINAHQEANKYAGELRHMCADYEKRIRAYEENVQAMQRRIAELETGLEKTP